MLLTESRILSLKMTLENCKLRLEVAKKANDSKDIKFWEDRILSRGGKLNVPEKKEVKEDGKK